MNLLIEGYTNWDKEATLCYTPLGALSRRFAVTAVQWWKNSDAASKKLKKKKSEAGLKPAKNTAMNNE